MALRTIYGDDIFLAPGENQYGCEKKAPSPGSRHAGGGHGFSPGSIPAPVLAAVPTRVTLVGTREYVPTNISRREYLRGHVPAHFGRNHTFIFKACAIK